MSTSLPRDAPQKGGHWIFARLEVDAKLAATPPKAIVADEVYMCGGFYERLEFLFAFFCHGFSTGGVIL